MLFVHVYLCACKTSWVCVSVFACSLFTLRIIQVVVFATWSSSGWSEMTFSSLCYYWDSWDSEVWVIMVKMRKDLSAAVFVYLKPQSVYFFSLLVIQRVYSTSHKNGFTWIHLFCLSLFFFFGINPLATTLPSDLLVQTTQIVVCNQAPVSDNSSSIEEHSAHTHTFTSVLKTQICVKLNNSKWCFKADSKIWCLKHDMKSYSVFLCYIFCP